MMALGELSPPPSSPALTSLTFVNFCKLDFPKFPHFSSPENILVCMFARLWHTSIASKFQFLPFDKLFSN